MQESKPKKQAQIKTKLESSEFESNIISHRPWSNLKKNVLFLQLLKPTVISGEPHVKGVFGRQKTEPVKTRASRSAQPQSHLTSLGIADRWGIFPVALGLPPAITSQIERMSFLATSAVTESVLKDGSASCWHPPGLCPGPHLRPEALVFGGPAHAGRQASRQGAGRPTSGRFFSS